MNNCKITKENLEEMFLDKHVKIESQGTHATVKNPDHVVRGICKAVHQCSNGFFDIEFKNGSRYSFVPEILTSNSVEGPLCAESFTKRKVSLI